MAFQDFLLRARRQASLIAFNAALPNNFKLIYKPETEWLVLPGVTIDPIDPFTLKAGVYDPNLGPDDPGLEIEAPILSTVIHLNLRVVGGLGPDNESHEFSGWDGLFIEEGDPDFDDGEGSGDLTLDNSKFKRWFKNNGVERLDDASEHPRSGRADMRWFRWTDGTEWLDITIDDPVQRRQIWL